MRKTVRRPSQKWGASKRPDLARIQTILHGSPLGAHSYRLDPNDRLIFTSGNPAADRILGIDHRSFVGLTIEEAFPDLIHTHIPDAYRKVARTGQPYVASTVMYDYGGIKGGYDIYAFQTSRNQMSVLFTDTLDQHNIADTLQLITEQVWTRKGKSFLDTLTTFLASKLAVDCVVIFEIITEDALTHVVSSNIDSLVPEDPQYPVENSPIPLIMQHGIVEYSKGAREAFPQDPILTKVHAESFIGILLRNTLQEPIGVIAILHSRPLEKKASIESLVQLVSLRVTHELEQMRAEEQIIHYNERLEQLVEERTNEINVREANLEALIENTSDSIWSVDTQYRIVTLNTSLQQDFIHAFGCHPQVGDNILQLADPSIRPAWKDRYDRALAGEQLQVEDQYEFEGVRQVFEVALNPIRVGNRIAGVACFSRNITQRVLSDIELTKTAERLQMATRAGQLGTWEWDLTTGRVDVTDDFLNLIGTDRANSPDILDYLFNRIAPDDLPVLINKVKQFRGDSLQYLQGEFRFNHPEKSWVWFYVTSIATESDHNHRPIKAVGYLQDITERKNAGDLLLRQARELALANERLDLTLSSTGVGIWYWDLIADRMFWDKNMLSLHRLDPGFYTSQSFNWEEAIKRTVHPEDLYRVNRIISDALSGKRTGYEIEYRVQEAEGHIHHLTARGHVQVDDQGKPVKLMNVCWDISEQKRSEAQLATAIEAAESANQAKSVFLANMSHEIRTPMNAIIGYAQLLQRDHSLSPNQREYIQIIGRSGDHLLTLINDILEMSKIEAGRVFLYDEIFDFFLLIQDIASMFRMRTDEKSLNFHVSVAPDLPRFVSCDSGKVRQVLINLMGNAVKFTEKGGIQVQAYLARRPQDTSEPTNRICICVRVEDTGIGIPPDKINIIFNPFEQGNTTRQISGTGLGLSISRQYARMMNGDITVESQPGHGSTFYFYFYANLVDSTSSWDSRTKESLRIVGLAPGQPVPRILIVDDNESNRSVLRLFLEKVGFLVDEASDGQQAIEMFKNWEPHAILMDRYMPTLDGIEATSIIRNLPEGGNVPIIIISASAMKENHYEAILMGADYFIRKPYRESEVLETIKKVLSLEYIYEEPVDLLTQIPEMVNFEKPEMPGAELTQELIQATEAGDTLRLQILIEEKVLPHWPVLGYRLQVMASDFEYTEIIQLLSGETNNA